MGVWSFQVVVDCDDPTGLSDFWHQALQYGPGRWLDDHREWLEMHAGYLGTQGACQHAERRHPRLYIQKVSEPKQGLNRVRPELSLPRDAFDREVTRLTSLGAEQVDQSCLRDPEGNEFLVAPGDGERRMSAIEFDALNPAAQLGFWSAALGDAQATAPPHPSPELRFVPTNERKTRKNRMHLDVNVTDAEDSLRERRRLVDLGARVLRPEENGNEVDEWSERGCVMRDPEGNEFCVQATKR